MARHRSKCGRCAQMQEHLEILERINVRLSGLLLPSINAEQMNWEFGIYYFLERDTWWGWDTLAAAQKSREAEYAAGTAPGMFTRDEKSELVCRKVPNVTRSAAIWSLTSP